MKRLLILGLILAALLAVILFTIQSKSVQSIEGQTPQQKAGNKPAQLLPAKNSKAANLSPLDPLPRVELKEAKYVPDYVALARSRENPPFEFRGGGTSGKVVDRQGHVLMESGKDIGIFGVAVGPDKQRVLVKGGDAKNFVLYPTTGQKLQLPVYPPGVNMLGFGWHWIGETKLLGLSGVEALNAKGVPVNCCDAHNVAQTKLYVYDLTTQQLAEVVMPSKVTQSVVNVVDVSSDGHVHLVHEEPHGGAEQDLGWFKLDIPK